MTKRDDLTRSFQPLNDLVSGEGTNLDQVHFPNYSKPEFDAAVDRICDEFDQAEVTFEQDPQCRPGVLMPVFHRK